jgi:hypothetical protein
VRKSLISIVIVGVVSMIFLSVMSTVYLSHLPTRDDLAKLELHIRRQHGLYLSVAAPIEATFLDAENDGPGGLMVRCSVRRDLERKPAAIDVHLKRIADSILDHPDWRVYIRRVTVEHVGRINRSVTKVRRKQADEQTP